MNDPFWTGSHWERRKDTRFDISCVSHYEWIMPNGSVSGRGVTRNISLSGVLLTIKNPVPVKSHLRIRVHFDTNLSGPNALAVLSTVGQVMRVKPTPDGRHEVALRTLKYSFESSKGEKIAASQKEVEA